MYVIDVDALQDDRTSKTPVNFLPRDRSPSLVRLIADVQSAVANCENCRIVSEDAASGPRSPDSERLVPVRALPTLNTGGRFYGRN
jgi:hypothetical protein